MIRLRYYCPFAKPTGYAQAAHEYLAALAMYPDKVELEIVPMLECDTDDLEPEYAHLAEFIKPRGREPTHVVSHTIPRYAHLAAELHLYGPDVKKIAVTTWETQFLPSEDAELLEQNFDAVVVPSDWCAGVMGLPLARDGGGLVNVVPHCHDPAWWKIPHAPAPAGPHTFLWIGAWSERKNPVGVLKAYFAAFRKSDDVLLRMVIPRGTAEDALQCIEALARGMGLSDYPKLELLINRMSMSDIRALHYGSHCYITTTRGEAWGLGSFEAAVVGNEVIAPLETGHEQYLMAYPQRYEISSTMTPCALPEPQTGDALDLGGIKFPAREGVLPAAGIAGDQFWLEPNLEEVIDAMRASYANHSLWARCPSREAFEVFSRKSVGAEFVKLLEGL